MKELALMDWLLNSYYGNEVCIVTHGGKFHADDVYGTAMLNLAAKFVMLIATTTNENYNREDLFEKAFELASKSPIKVFRINQKNFDSDCEKIRNENQNIYSITFDVGNGRYDHHNDQLSEPWYHDVEFDGEEDLKRCAGARIWKELMEMDPYCFGLSEKYAKRFDNEFWKVISKGDCYGPQKYPNELSRIIAGFNSKSIYDESSQMPAFKLSVQTAMNIIYSLISSLLRQQKDEQDAIKALSNSIFDGRVVVSDKYVSANEYMKMNDNKVQFVVFKTDLGTWNVVSTTSERYKIANTYVTDVNCSFVHASKFMAVFDIKEDAIECARKSIV